MTVKPTNLIVLIFPVLIILVKDKLYEADWYWLGSLTNLNGLFILI